jgi:hypothetical protein
MFVENQKMLLQYIDLHIDFYDAMINTNDFYDTIRYNVSWLEKSKELTNWGAWGEGGAWGAGGERWWRMVRDGHTIMNTHRQSPPGWFLFGGISVHGSHTWK